MKIRQSYLALVIFLILGISSGCTSTHYVYTDRRPAPRVVIVKRHPHPHKHYWFHRGAGTSW